MPGGLGPVSGARLNAGTMVLLGMGRKTSRAPAYELSLFTNGAMVAQTTSAAS